MQDVMQPGGRGTLFVVATPIGNLQDITLRAIQVLSSVAVIACEDTRTSGKLLSALNIHTPTVAIHQHSAETDIQSLVERLCRGQDVALITDAGTPGVSDPGGKVVAAARASGAPVMAVPGPSALTAALSISGIDVSHFLFLGFMPQVRGRQGVLKQIATCEEAVALYESTHRIEKLLHELETHIAERPVVVIKELTKIFERTFLGSAREILKDFSADPKFLQGEFVVIVAPKKWKLLFPATPPVL